MDRTVLRYLAGDFYLLTQRRGRVYRILVVNVQNGLVLGIDQDPLGALFFHALLGAVLVVRGRPLDSAAAIADPARPGRALILSAGDQAQRLSSTENTTNALSVFLIFISLLVSFS